MVTQGGAEHSVLDRPLHSWGLCRGKACPGSCKIEASGHQVLHSQGDTLREWSKGTDTKPSCPQATLEGHKLPSQVRQQLCQDVNQGCH